MRTALWLVRAAPGGPCSRGAGERGKRGSFLKRKREMERKGRMGRRLCRFRRGGFRVAVHLGARNGERQHF